MRGAGGAKSVSTPDDEDAAEEHKVSLDFNKCKCSYLDEKKDNFNKKCVCEFKMTPYEDKTVDKASIYMENQTDV